MHQLNLTTVQIMKIYQLARMVLASDEDMGEVRRQCSNILGGKDHKLTFESAIEAKIQFYELNDVGVAQLQKQAMCTHHHNGVSQYSPYLHAWKCDKCGHIRGDGD